MTNSKTFKTHTHFVTSPTKKYWVLIPAAGTGSRMNSNTPKQYLSLNGFPVLTHTISQFLDHPLIAGVMVVIAATDNNWDVIKRCYRQLDDCSHTTTKLCTCVGGESRFDSVIAGLKALQNEVQSEQWILVHDAARPGISQQDLEHLFNSIILDAKIDGYILAQKSVDTLKVVSDDALVESSLDRNKVWAAQTPQIFRYQQLYQTLQNINADDGNSCSITDESSAMEQAGFKVKIIAASDGNFKITVADDIPRMEFEISYQQQQGIRINPEKYFSRVDIDMVLENKQ